MILKKRAWYAEKCLENCWSFVLLDHQIDLNLYQRQSDNSAKLTNCLFSLRRTLPSPRI
ncbi:MAG: hypothetical protein IJS37_00120 [Bacilli bacterium]|nr:hypothetical protein [Bacilli bacterium]